ncbi:UDP-N-acetylmuramoyl-L-alanyl-D-glutamate--2,6-diaminopimelate ligase [Sinomonas sp. JGH33]|uniref:UDP-N-acetylmuramyl-tripeptide synthetase n=1 Tax=Sinomonas terricola TaxID=3110330 RepID=A0ABU5TBH8_9MICC|nr:UDP-N-acetylmuramoyl-L-alanyl-D-glutamate--2,6-diaminopimelate ligase [Sinomonas sp. JGH33]MEA5456882.1 UDP-N-acetylmuramoyl-L-alanyl-D-glutamate--2,6-diaminopimelate ligase [Sinomonas sp. JGH33]
MASVAALLGLPEAAVGGGAVTGVSLDSRSVESGDLYVAVPGTGRHGASFAAQAVERGAAAVLTDEAGARLVAIDDTLASVPVLVVEDVRAAVGPVAAFVYRSQTGGEAEPHLLLLGVTGTNGKTTTTYFANALLAGLGHRTGLIGTIEILAGGDAIPSRLTTPESTDVHALLALMRERGLTAASMEVSSHAVEYRRVDGVRYDAVGFTNLTQDHLDLHLTMDEYFAAKARLFAPDRAARGVVVVDDEWGRRLAREAAIPVTTVSLAAEPAPGADWALASVRRSGLGTAFELRGPDGQALRLHTGLPGAFNVANAALAALLVHAAGVPLEEIQRAADAADPFSVEVPGRMQLVGTRPAAVVDFAHNPDALERALEAVRPPGEGRLVVVFGATGQRDQGKRPIMGAVAVRGADVVVITDDDPHDEDPAAIRADVLAGARAEDEALGLGRIIEEVAPRAAAIRRAVDLASAEDVILVAGRGHEVFQEVKGVDLELDDRVELRAALEARGFSTVGAEQIESTTDD